MKYKAHKIKIKYEYNADKNIFLYVMLGKRKLCECHTRFFFQNATLSPNIFKKKKNGVTIMI